jgi:hypothetical protein
MWWMLLLQIVAQLLQWILKQREENAPLSVKDQARVAKFMGMARQVESVAIGTYGVYPEVER